MWKRTANSRQMHSLFRPRCIFPHNASMPLREAPHSVPFLILCLLLPLSAAEAKTRPVPALDSSYVSALAAADRFLQAWQSGDVENGMVLLSNHARESATTDVVDTFFSNAGTSAYEITRGKLLKRDRYEFPVVLVGSSSTSNRARRRFTSIVIVNTGNNDWAVDKLP
jgi:hypothetical protein